MDDKLNPIDPTGSLAQMIEKIKNFDISKYSYSIATYDIDFISQQIRDSVAEVGKNPLIPEGYFEKTQEYQQQSLEMLKSINQNTANLYTLVDLISNSNEQQDEIIEIVSEILAIAKAKDKKEAESFLKRAMSKINDTVESTESILKLVGWATAIYQIIITMLPK